MISKTSIVILGILYNENLSAYEILKRIEHMEMKYWWPIGDTTLYETALRLEKKNLIQGTRSEETESTNKKHVYSITEEGREELKSATKEIFLRVDYDTIWFSLALMYHSILTKTEITKLVKKRRSLLQEYSSAIEQNLAEHKDNPRVLKSALLTMERMNEITKLELKTLDSL